MVEVGIRVMPNWDVPIIPVTLMDISGVQQLEIYKIPRGSKNDVILESLYPWKG